MADENTKKVVEEIEKEKAAHEAAREKIPVPKKVQARLQADYNEVIQAQQIFVQAQKKFAGQIDTIRDMHDKEGNWNITTNQQGMPVFDHLANFNPPEPKEPEKPPAPAADPPKLELVPDPEPAADPPAEEEGTGEDE